MTNTETSPYVGQEIMEGGVKRYITSVRFMHKIDAGVMRTFATVILDDGTQFVRFVR